MSHDIVSPVTQLLDQHNIPFDVIEIPLTEDKKPIRNLEELLETQGRDPYSVIRSLLFRAATGDFILLAVAGGGRADWSALRKHLDVRKLRMAEFSEIEPATGYVMGAVPPIALPDSVRVLVDESLSDYSDVIIGSGVLGYALSLLTTDLGKLLSEADAGKFIKS